MIFSVPKTVEQLIQEAEDKLGLTGVVSLPGPSKFGWSKLKKFLQCDYLAFYQAPEGAEAPSDENENKALGTVVHRLLEYHYLPEPVCDPVIYLGALKEVGLPDDLFTEAKRIFTGYVRFYASERSYLTPLNVEHELADPATGLTCKIDLLADFVGHGKLDDGVYILDHKTRSRIDTQCLNEWFLDGQVWTNMHLCDRNGIQVKGFIANIIGKQKTQRFERIVVPFSEARLERFRRDLYRWLTDYREAEYTVRTQGCQPTRKYACTGRYGLCELYQHCRAEL